MDFRDQMCEGVDSFHVDPVTDACEHDSELLGSTDSGKLS
jgi:hypothetical protein